MTDTLATSQARHAWLESAATYCAALLADVDCNVPAKVRVSVGWTGNGAKSKAIGECWSPVASADQHAEIFISPRLSDSVEILGVVAHELIHAAVGHEAGHKAPFARPAKALGLVGKMTATVPGDELTALFKQWLEVNGDYPAGNLSPMDNGKKKQGTRLIKAICDCGYTVRITKKWIEEVGAPHCPMHGAMTCQGMDAEGEGEGEGDE
jgi:hypothetical protein